MATSVQCENCSAPVAGDAPSGLCPNCLLRMAIEHGASRALAPFLPKLNYFGDYELLEEIARGGMGVVYRARQVSLDRTVGVKMMRPGLLASEAEIVRFRSEARTAAGLQHPNIVAIHEVGQFDGLHYFSMDFVEGPSLAALVRERPLSPPECARYVRVLAETVQYAHARGVLHRDLKPSNVLVDAAGRPHITDFGLARHLEKDMEVPSGGSVVGTPAYMPPEQASGRDDRLGATADVYSLGAILYELLTGQPPFRAASQAETVRMVLEEKAAPPRSLNPAVTAGLEAICLRCLEKDPANRYQTAGDLAVALEDAASGDPVAVPVRNWFARYKWLAFAFTTGVACFTTIAILSSVTNRRPAVVERPSTTVPGASAPRPSPAPPSPAPAAASGTAQEARSVAARIPPATVASAPAAALPSVAPTPPSPGVSVTPDSGSGSSQIFVIRYNDAQQIEVDIHDAAATGNRHCDIVVDTATGQARLQFFADRGPGIRVEGALGSLTRPDNSVCAMDLAKGSLSHGEISLPVIFKPGFEGEKEVEAWRLNAAGLRLEKSAPGRWNVTR